MIPRDDRQARLAFLELGEEDLADLRHLEPVLEKHADALVAAFNRHLLSFEVTYNLLSDPNVRNRLLVKQREYLLSLACSPIDQAYFDSRIAIGITHVRVGVEPRWILGAYALYHRLLVPVIREGFPRNAALAERIVVSLHKRLMLDAQLAMESYIGLREERALLAAALEKPMTLRELANSYTDRILDLVHGNKVRAARILGINRRTLYRRGESRHREASRTASKETS